MAKHFLVWGIVIALVIGGIAYVKVVEPAMNNHDELAKCLSANGAMMYGAYWCPHCQEQKKMFGKSVKYMSHIDCAVRGSTEILQICKDAGVENFPTWKFRSGEKVTGIIPLDRLARLAGCE